MFGIGAAANARGANARGDGDPSLGSVLGIDPGLSRCGYGVVRAEGSRPVAVAYGVIRTEPASPLPDRLARLAAELDVLVAELAPAALAVERVLFQVNARTAMAVGQASGLALVAAARAGIPVTHYSPNEVKLGLAGDGAAGKEQVQQMVQRVLRLAEVPRPADAADALALALHHLWRQPLDNARRRAEGPAPDRTDGAPPPGRTNLDRAVAAALARDAS